MNRDRTRIDETWRHAQKSKDLWGELQYTPNGRRAVYWRTWMCRGGWMITVWQRWIPRTHNQVRPAGYFGRGVIR